MDHENYGQGNDEVEWLVIFSFLRWIISVNFRLVKNGLMFTGLNTR